MHSSEQHTEALNYCGSFKRLFSSFNSHTLFSFIYSINNFFISGSDSPTSTAAARLSKTPVPGEVAEDGLPNEISAPYEVPQFPIEQIEKKLQIQRQLNEAIPSR